MKPKEKEYMCIYRPDPDAGLWSDASRGIAAAQAALGRLYFTGQRPRSSDVEYEDVIVGSYTPALEPDLSLAVKWLLKAARQGHAEAKQLLATIIAKGRGVH